MTYNVRITKDAKLDMKGIYEYIANILKEPIIAQKQYTYIENAIYSLDQMPERFRRYEKQPWRERNLRVMPVNNYIVFYCVDNEKKIVTIIRIMYGGRDIDRELNKTEL